MSTTNHTIQGTALWAKVFEANRDMVGFEGKAVEYDGQYTIQVNMDKPNRAIYKSSGSAGRIKFDDDGIAGPATFRRKHKDRYEGESGAPRVTDAKGNIWTMEDQGIIPNGSEVEVNFDVYTTSQSNGTRLKSVKVLKKADMPDREEKQKEPEANRAVYDEDIPF